MRKFWIALLVFGQAGLAFGQNQAFHAEGLPNKIVARLEVRDRLLSELPASTNGFSPQFVVESLKRWPAGSALHVAFNGGNNAVRKAVADAATTWLTHGNIRLDFGYNAATGAYRSWTSSDATYANSIRISFDQAGYWSLVGTDSEDPAIVSPGEASMNFGGFNVSLPSDYKAIVAHEFGHALGFHHEHQSPLGGCDSQFHWFDDPGYRVNRDQFGQYIPDSLGHRPGIYTVLGGPPNNWPAAQVDFNLKQLKNSSAFSVGPFDPKSIMMYAFPAWMFVSANSPCRTTENLVLSMQDQSGFQQAYPFSPGEILRQQTQRKQFLTMLSDAQVPTETKERFKTMLNALP